MHEVGEWTETQNNLCHFGHKRRQNHQWTKTIIEEEETRRQQNSPNMTAAASFKISPIISIFVCFLLLASSVSSHSGDYSRLNQTFRPGHEQKKLHIIRALLKKINKPSVKTIQVILILFPCFGPGL